MISLPFRLNPISELSCHFGSSKTRYLRNFYVYIKYLLHMVSEIDIDENIAIPLEDRYFRKCWI